ncbi:MAG: NADH-quinone oxidoreductase subunit C [Cytophagaceae bacterium]|nr:NADH-quinone oxidoreductase subunit C [Cytophagaceae bacterium]
MQFEEIKNIISDKIGSSAIIKEDAAQLQPQLTVDQKFLLSICRELHVNPSLYFDYLSCITGIDNGPEKGTMEVIYHLYSIPFNHHFILKVELQRTIDALPSAPSVTSIWKTADWHEREVYDMFGIKFEGHPDLRRILLPADWEGYPLRKDYKQQEYYHGIKVEY